MARIFEAPTVGREALLLFAADANTPILAFVGYGLVRLRDPLALLLAHPWLLFSALAFPVSLAVAQLGSPRRVPGSPRAFGRTLAAALAVVVALGSVFFFTADRSRVPEIFGLLGLAMLLEVAATRGLVYRQASRRQALCTALVIGAGAEGVSVVDCTLREPRLRVRVAGFIDDDPLKRNFQHKGVSVLDNGPGVGEIAARLGVTLIVSAEARPQSAELIRNLLQLKMAGIEIVEMPTFFERVTGQCPIRNVNDSWFLYSNGFDHLHRPWLQAAKRSVDLLFALVGIALSLPLAVIVALLVKLESRGPLFSRVECVGRNEKPFFLVKFRTLRADSPVAEAHDLASVRDYRVTRIGRWLRLTRLDEIPQLINVLRGEISLVGPRAESPLRVARLKESIPYYGLRFAVKPGLTGWAQVQSGYGSAVGEEAVEKLQFDLYYLKHLSGALDARIAFKTGMTVLMARGG